jgi:hypothetical protein
MNLNLTYEDAVALLDVLGGYVEDAEEGVEAECPCPDLPRLQKLLAAIESYVAK